MQAHIHQGVDATTVTITAEGSFPNHTVANILEALADVYPMQGIQVTHSAEAGSTHHSVTGDRALFINAVRAGISADEHGPVVWR